MATNMALALQITLLGMGLVFAMILLLWGVIFLIVRLTPDRTNGEEISTGDDELLRQQAIAVAVAIAMANKKEIPEWHEFPLPPTALVSPWQSIMRTKMLNKRGSIR